jgi:hypothetical protein
VYGTGNGSSGYGVFGTTTNGISGVAGTGNGYGGYFITSGTGTNAIGVYAGSANGSQPAGHFQGDVQIAGNLNVTGSLSKGSGSFLIDHPLDPAHKSLYHSFVESPDMKNIYDGVAVLDERGQAVVTLPAWFGAINSNFCYQLTCLGGHAPVYVAQKIENNQFAISGGEPGLEVSWQVTGIRQDLWAQAHRIPVEQEKSAEQQGRYHHPALYGQSEKMSIMYSSQSSQL